MKKLLGVLLLLSVFPGLAFGQSTPFGGAASVGGSGGTSAVDGSGYVAGTTPGTPVMGAMDDAAITACAENQNCIARVTALRALHVNLRDNSGNEVSVGGGTQYDQGTVTTDTDKLTMAGCVRSDTPAVPTGVIDGDRVRCIVDSTGRMWIHVGQIDGTVTVTGPLTDVQLRATPVPVSGTVTVTDGAGALNVIVDSGTTAVTQATASNLKAQVQGEAASGAAKAGNPVQVGGVFNTTQPTVTTGQAVELQSTARGAAIVAPGVDGFTVTANAGTGTFAVSAASLPLPTGAATLAEQQTQTTALQLIDNLPLAQGSTTSGQSGVLSQGAVTTGAPTYTTGQTSPLSLTTGGDLRTNCSNCSGSGATHVDNAAFTGGTDDVAPAGFLFDTTPPAITDGNLGAARMNSSRQVLIEVAQPLPAGTNNIGDVDVLSVVPGTGATNLGKAVDSAAGATDTGVAILAIRDDATTTLTPVDGDYVNLRTNARGALWVDLETRLDSTNDSVTAVGAAASGATKSGNPVQTGAVFNTTQPTVTTGQAVENQATARGAQIVATGVDTFTVTCSNCSGGTQYTEDAAAATDPVGNAIIVVRNDARSGSLTTADGDNVALRGTNAGELYVSSNTAQINGVAPLMGNGVTGTGSQRVTIASDNTAFTVNAAQSGTWNINNVSGTVSLPTGAATSANQDGIIRDGTGDTTQANVTSGRLNVDGSGVTQPISGTVTANAGSGTFNNQQSNTQIDYDTGAGAQNLTVFGLALPASGGSVAGGTSTNPVRVDPTGTTTQPVSGTVTANAGTGNFNVIGTASDNSTNSTAKLPVIPAVANASDPTRTEGNQVPLSTDLAGRMRVTCNNCGGSGGTAQADESTFTEGTTSFTPVGGVLNDTITSDPTEDQAAAVRITPKRAIHVNLRDQSGAEVSVGGGTQYDQGTATTATDKLMMAGAIRRDTAALDAGVADGDRAALSVNNLGRLHTSEAHAQPAATSQSITADGAGTAVDVTGYSQVLLTIQGTYALATNGITFEVSPDATNYFTILGHGLDDAVAQTSTGAISNVSRAWHFNTTGMTRFRTNTDWSSGTVNVTITPVAAPTTGSLNATLTGTPAVSVTGNTTVIQGTASNFNAQVQGPAASGASKAGNPVQVGGVFNTTQPTVTTGQSVELQSTARGAAIVAPGVDGFTVTANAGTNLNTSALNLETTQASVLTSVQLIDDSVNTTGSAITTKGLAAVGTDGTNARILKTDTSGELQIDVLSSALPTGAATETTLGAVLTSTNFAAAFGTAGTADSQVMSVQGIASMTPVQVSHSGAVQQYVDPCQREAKIRVSINQTAGTQLATGTASERIYICSFHVVTATAQNVALVSGTGTVCATSPSGVEGFGGSTAATGWNFAANGGIAMAASGHAYGNTDTDADNLCLLQSGAGQVSGGLTYVSATSGL